MNRPTAEHVELDSDDGLQRIRIVTDDGDVIEYGVTLDALVDLARIGRTVDRYLDGRGPRPRHLRAVPADPDEDLRELADFLLDRRRGA